MLFRILRCYLYPCITSSSLYCAYTTKCCLVAKDQPDDQALPSAPPLIESSRLYPFQGQLTHPNSSATSISHRFLLMLTPPRHSDPLVDMFLAILLLIPLAYRTTGLTLKLTKHSFRTPFAPHRWGLRQRNGLPLDTMSSNGATYTVDIEVGGVILAVIVSLTPMPAYFTVCSNRLDRIGGHRLGAILDCQPGLPHLPFRGDDDH